MATKTISLELDAYEKLKRMKRGKESFSSVVRRAEYPPAAHTGAAILKSLSALYQHGNGITGSSFAYWEQAVAEDAARPRISASKWDSR